MTARTEVIVTAPNPTWPTQFEAESTLIRGALAGLAIDLHHIGSTAIRGINAKPVIDMLLVAPKLADLDDAAPALASVGYEAMGEFGILSRRYFRKTTASGVRTHQLHAFAKDSQHVTRHIAFRDYMNAHPQAAQAYSQLKIQLAAAHPNDMSAYMDGKDPFVKLHETKALAWLRVWAG